MGQQTVIVYHSPTGRLPPDTLGTLAGELDLVVAMVDDPAEVMALVNRTLPRAVVLDGVGNDSITELCQRIKSDAFSAIVPVVVLAQQAGQCVLKSLAAGADEVLTATMEERER